MTFQTWGAAALAVAVSLLFGHTLNLLGLRCRAAAPAIGLSILILISSIAIKLPGNAVTAAIVVLLLVVAAAVLTVMRRGAIRPRVTPLAVIAISAFGAAIPFLASGRVGLLGVGLDNDMAAHLEYADALRSPATRAIYGLPGAYPLGPHSLADVLASGLGVRLDLAFTAVMIATVIVTALTGANALIGEAGFKRVVAGVLSALLYLTAAYYAEAAFKEQLMGMLLLALAVHLQEVRSRPLSGGWGLWRALVPAAVLVATGIYVYGYLAVAWLLLAPAIWLAAEVVLAPGRLRRWRTQVRDLGPATVGAGAVAIVLMLPVAGRIINLFTTYGVSPASTGAIGATQLGNLVAALPPYEALGIWHSNDFRLLPVDQLHAGLLAGLALGVLIVGLVRSLARRELLLPAAVAACALIYWRSSHGQSPYVTAKALAIAGPVVAVTGLRGLLVAPRLATARSLTLSGFAVAAVFVVFAARSSYQALANEPVWPGESTNELLALDQVTRGHTVLFLGASDFTQWLFHDSRMSALSVNSLSLGAARPRLPTSNEYGAPLDFGSVVPSDLNRFGYVITTNTPYATQPPGAFQLVRRLPLYELWHRVGTIGPRQTIAPAGAPGALLNCGTRSGRALSHARGVASVMSTPVGIGGGPIAPGGTLRLALPLPAGRWELSLQYVSNTSLEIDAGTGHWTMPAYLDRPGPVFQVGAVTSSGGTVPVTIHQDRPSSLTGPLLTATVSTLLATRTPDTRTLAPLSRACGRYIDWYRTDTGA